jgi:integrase
MVEREGGAFVKKWADFDLARHRVHVTAKPEYGFLPKDWEERTVPLTREVVEILKRHPAVQGCPVVFRSPQGDPLKTVQF